MPKKSPKPQPEPPADAAPVQTPAPAKPRPQPISVRKVDLLSPEEKRQRERFYEDSAEIEESLWRTIYG